MSLFNKKIMDYFAHPRNAGIIENADGIGEVDNAQCDDIIRIYLKINDDIITDAKFETFGCSFAIACSSMATVMIKGKPVTDALALSSKALTDALSGLPENKMHCSVHAEESVKAAVKNYYDKYGIKYNHSLFPDNIDRI